jgi:hypothetical protein
MDKLHKTSVSIMGLVALALFAAFATGYISRPAPGAAAQPAAQPAATAAATAAAKPASSDQQRTNADVEKYANALVANFASRLGVDQARLNSAFTAAANDTVDQAVRDGKVTQDEATKIKLLASSGLSGVLMALPSVSSGEKGMAVSDDSGIAVLKMSGAVDSLWNAAATTIGISREQLQSEQQAGKSIAEVAQAHNVSLQKVKDAVLAAARAAISSQVQAGKLTQAQADKINSDLPTLLDQLLNNKPRSGEGSSTSELAAWNAAAAAIGVNPGDMKRALGSGQSLADQARAHNVDPNKVRDAALAAARADINSHVQAGKMTQAQGDAQYSEITRWLDSFMNTAPKIPEATPTAGQS